MFLSLFHHGKLLKNHNFLSLTPKSMDIAGEKYAEKIYQ
jgi:hypothetical protein